VEGSATVALALEPARLRCGVDTPACGKAATGGRDEVGIEQPASGLEDASDLGQRLRQVGNVVGRLVGVDEVELVVSEGKVGGFGDLEAHATGPARSSRTASSSNDPTNRQAVTLTPHDTLIHRPWLFLSGRAAVPLIVICLCAVVWRVVAP
jgi:hypothetical protein